MQKKNFPESQSNENDFITGWCQLLRLYLKQHYARRDERKSMSITCTTKHMFSFIAHTNIRADPLDFCLFSSHKRCAHDSCFVSLNKTRGRIQVTLSQFMIWSLCRFITNTRARYTLQRRLLLSLYNDLLFTSFRLLSELIFRRLYTGDYLINKIIRISRFMISWFI